MRSKFADQYNYVLQIAVGRSINNLVQPVTPGLLMGSRNREFYEGLADKLEAAAKATPNDQERARLNELAKEVRAGLKPFRF
jgi:hypothetical protein